MALLRVEPYIVDSVGNFVFSSATVTSNVTAGNVKTDNLLYANGDPYKVSSFTNDTGYLVAANLSSYATQTDVSNAVANLVASAPSALDTLNELANALGNDASYSTTITNALANKLSTSSFTSTADTWLATKSTSDVSEGTNQYYTVTRANTAIDNRVSKTFVDNLAVVANIANVAYSVDGANVTGAVQYAAIANSVSVANVTGIGNIATINKDGNSSNVLYGNGVFASAPVTYANSNVANYLPTYTGDLSPGNITIATGNLKLTGGTSGYVLSTDGSGNLSWVQQSSGGSSSSQSIETTVDSFTGDGVTTTFTLSITPQTINQTFVNYNGALQLRSSYSLNGANIVFSEAPANGSQFEVTTQTNVITGSGIVTANSLSVGNLSVTSYVTGNLVPNANVTYNLGSATNRWKDLYLSGNTIDLAGAKIKSDPATGAIAFVPPTTVDVPNPTALVISPLGGISTASTTNGVLTANAISVAASVNTLVSPRYITMYKTGEISASVGTSRYYPPSNVVINSVFASLSGSSTTDLSFAIYKNGSNTGAYTISANSYVLSNANANISLSSSDYLTVNILSGTGTDLKLDLQYTPAA